MRRRINEADWTKFRIRGKAHQIWSSEHEIVVLGSPDSDDEDGEDSHNCDANGCGQDHVLWRQRIASGSLSISDVLSASDKRHETDRMEIARLEGLLAVAREEIEKRRRHPMAPERCPVCEWTNTNLMNYGESGRSDWRCHGCAARSIRQSCTYRGMLADVIASAHPNERDHPAMSEQWRRANELLAKDDK